MQILFLSLILFTALGPHQPMEEVVWSIPGHLDFDMLMVPGKVDLSIEAISSKESKVIGTVVFEKVAIGNIKECRMEWRLKGDFLVSNTISTTKAKYSKVLLDSVLTKFGSPSTQTIEEGKLVMLWETIKSDKHYVFKKYEVYGKRKGAAFQIWTLQDI